MIHCRRPLPLLLAGVALAAALAAGCAGVFGGAHPGQPLAPEARAYVDSVFTLMEEHALAEGPVDWAELKREALYRAGGARAPRDTHKALQWALKQVNAHSFLMLPERWAEMEMEARSKPPVPTGQMLDGGVAYIGLPTFMVQDSELVAEYAVTGQQLIRGFFARGACGWIIDLRRNSGGNMYPMLLAVGPLLGDGAAGFFRAGVGMIRAWGYQDGKAWFGTDTMARLPRGVEPNPPLEQAVAVLTGPITASSAEALTVAFRGVPRAMSFGASTAGFSTGNTGYRLSDGATVLITELVLGDRLGREYGERIRPDRSVGGALWNLFADADDTRTTAAAADWLRHTPACKDRKQR